MAGLYQQEGRDSTGNSYLVIKCINLPSPSKNSWHIARVKSQRKSLVCKQDVAVGRGFKKTDNLPYMSVAATQCLCLLIRSGSLWGFLIIEIVLGSLCD